MAPHAGKRASLTVAPGQCKPSGERFHSSRARPRRRALPTTDTELRLIASPAITRLSRRPVNGYSTPAAIGTPSAFCAEAQHRFRFLLATVAADTGHPPHTLTCAPLPREPGARGRPHTR